MSDNIFHDALEEGLTQQRAHAAKTHTVTNHPHFFQAAIEQQKLADKARNMTRQEMFNNGFIRVEDLDDEELRYGMCRDSRGRIPKRTNKTEMLPRDLYEAMVAEHSKRFDENLRQQLDVALNTMSDIMVDPTAEPKDKMEAAKWFVDRVRGKAVDRVQVQVSKAPWEELLGDVAHVTRAQHEARKMGIIDAEVVEEAPDSEAIAEQPQDVVEEPNFEIPVDQPWAAAEPAPSHDNPVNSNTVAAAPLSERMREAQDEAARVAEARAARNKLVQEAKRKRRAMRASGGDVLRRKLAEDIGVAQDRFAAMAPEHTPQDEP